jgi:curli biogenesis system outer membrane secretion channel CsgG
MGTRRVLAALAMVAGCWAVAGCAAQERRAMPTDGDDPVAETRGPRYKVVLGKVANESPYQRGIFSDGVDRLGGQARAILKTRLSRTDRFDVMDRDHSDEIAAEARLDSAPLQLKGAELLLSGAVTEFGRRETGAQALGGVLAQSRTQTAYAKVSVNVVDVRTSRIVRAFQGAGECELRNGGALGFGSTAGYDSTLNDKVLDLAVQEAVQKMIAALDRGEFLGIKER